MDYQTTPKQNPFVMASLIMGLLALITICTGILPLLFGSLGIIFAVLANRKGKRMETPAFIGVITSVVGLAMSSVIVVMSFAMLPTMLKSPEYREQLNTVSESMYGITFDEMMEEGYGIDLDELLGIE